MQTPHAQQQQQFLWSSFSTDILITGFVNVSSLQPSYQSFHHCHLTNPVYHTRSLSSSASRCSSALFFFLTKKSVATKGHWFETRIRQWVTIVIAHNRPMAISYYMT
jgi:hypothetical protein